MLSENGSIIFFFHTPKPVLLKINKSVLDNTLLVLKAFSELDDSGRILEIPSWP